MSTRLGIGQFRVAVDNNRKFRPDETGIPPTGIIGGDGGARFDLNGIYQFSDNFSFIRGSHNFKTGFELSALRPGSGGGQRSARET